MKRIFVYSTAVLLFFPHVLAVYSFETQNLNKEVFARRRQKLMDKMEGGKTVFSADAFDRDFYYLTGFDNKELTDTLTQNESSPILVKGRKNGMYQYF